MKKIFLIFYLFCFTSITSAQNYKLVWEDNFDHLELNESQHWTVEVNGDGGGNNEMQYYRRENIGIEQHTSGVNCLVINARRESFGGKLVTSGRLVTRGKVACKYGKIEARIKLPATANGLWPAFWMMGEDYSSVGWPKCGEIDILEMGNTNGIKNGTQDRYFNGACHWGESWNGGSYPNYAKATTSLYSLQDDFHLYTLIWDATAIKMYLDLDKYPDNTPYYEMTINGPDVDNNPSRYFHKPFSILLNLAVGGHFTGITGNSNLPKITALPIDGSNVKMYVDYVKIYQKGVEGELYSGPTLKTAINEQKMQVTDVYPNPVNSILRLSGTEEMSKINIFSITGQCIESINTPTPELNVSNLKSGLYLLNIVYKNKLERTINLIKK